MHTGDDSRHKRPRGRRSVLRCVDDCTNARTDEDTIKLRTQEKEEEEEENRKKAVAAPFARPDLQL